MEKEISRSPIDIKIETTKIVVSQFDYRDQAERAGQLSEGGSGESTSDGEGAE
jgi:hypothetical protein